MRGRRILLYLTAIVLCIVLSVNAFASNKVSSINVDVTIYPDGSAYIIQTWDGNFTVGTECYLPLTNLGEMKLRQFSVSDINGKYQARKKWNEDATFEQKARYCRLNVIDDGYEMRWGISQYGYNRYFIEYRLDGFVSAYDDSDGFLFRFVPSGMATLPTDVTVNIHASDGTPFNSSNSNMWAFGFSGQIAFDKNGQIFAYTEKSINNPGESVNIMLQFQKGVLTPAHTVNGSFESVKAKAFEASEHAKRGLILFIPALLISVIFALTLLWWACGADKRKVKKLYKATNYCREVPLTGNLEAAHVLARQFYQSDDDGNLITATFMKLLSTGCLAPVTENNTGFIGIGKEAVTLQLVHPPDFHGSTAKLLYEFLSCAANIDHILQEPELEEYCKKNFQAIINIMNEAKCDGRESLVGLGCYSSPNNQNGLQSLSERGQGQLMNLMGFKKYLLDFSVIGERGLSQAVIWQDYMIFATLLGISDEVIERLGQIYLDCGVYRQQAQTVCYVAYRYNCATWQAAKNAETASKRILDGKNSSSHGGDDSTGTCRRQTSAKIKL